MSRIINFTEIAKRKQQTIADTYSHHPNFGSPIYFIDDAILGLGGEGILICQNTLIIKKAFAGLKIFWYKHINKIECHKSTIYINGRKIENFPLVDEIELKNFIEYIASEYIENQKNINKINHLNNNQAANKESPDEDEILYYQTIKKIISTKILDDHEIESWRHIENLFELIMKIKFDLFEFQLFSELGILTKDLLHNILVDLAAYIYVELEKHDMNRETSMHYAQFPLIINTLFSNLDNRIIKDSDDPESLDFISSENIERRRNDMWYFFDHQIIIKRKNKKSAKIILHKFGEQHAGILSIINNIKNNQAALDKIELLIMKLERNYEAMIVDMFNSEFHPPLLLEKIPSNSFPVTLFSDFDDR